jgi:hypothetical protein
VTSPLSEKVEYVRTQGQTRRHLCHWPNCCEQVPPALWGCRTHWLLLPKYLRDRIWAAYEPGQEITGTPSDAYRKAAREVRAWIKKHYPPAS